MHSFPIASEAKTAVLHTALLRHSPELLFELVDPPSIAIAQRPPRVRFRTPRERGNIPPQGHTFLNIRTAYGSNADPKISAKPETIGKANTTPRGQSSYRDTRLP